jgi:hypothetical protein
LLTELQKQDIAVYFVQAPDRTGGALRRDNTKPAQVVERLTEGTGGRAFPINQPQDAAKAICDELRKNRYILSYSPTEVSYTDARRLLVTADAGINIRTKTIQPAQ